MNQPRPAVWCRSGCTALRCSVGRDFGDRPGSNVATCQGQSMSSSRRRLTDALSEVLTMKVCFRNGHHRQCDTDCRSRGRRDELSRTKTSPLKSPFERRLVVPLLSLTASSSKMAVPLVWFGSRRDEAGEGPPTCERHFCICSSDWVLRLIVGAA